VTAPPKKTLLPDLGNPLSGDDCFGPYVLGRLAHGGQEIASGITLINAGTDLLNHIESFVEYDHVVLIEAILDAEGKLGAPGRVERLEEGLFLSWSEQSRGVHQVSPLLGIKQFRLLHPESRVQIHLVGLLVDQLTHHPIYMTDEKIKEAAKMVQSLLQ
jgi:hydrogenase maturation protease